MEATEIKRTLSMRWTAERQMPRPVVDVKPSTFDVVAHEISLSVISSRTLRALRMVSATGSASESPNTMKRVPFRAVGPAVV